MFFLAKNAFNFAQQLSTPTFFDPFGNATKIEMILFVSDMAIRGVWGVSTLQNYLLLCQIPYSWRYCNKL